MFGSVAAKFIFEKMKKSFNFEKLEANPPKCVCPTCQSKNIKLDETFEDDSGMSFFSLKCADCGSRFILLEDLINSLRRELVNIKEKENRLIEHLETLEEL